MSKLDSSRDERLQHAKEAMGWDTERNGEPTIIEYLRYYRNHTIGEIHVEAAIDQYIQTERTAARIDEVASIVSTYQAVRDVMYEEVKKKGFDTSVSIKAVELMISNMEDRLAKLKATLKPTEGEK
jgi:hypothetical protein